MKKLNLIFAIIFLQIIQSRAQVITFEKTYGGTSGDWGNSVQQTDDGGYIITGTTLSFGAGSNHLYLVKTDANGDTLWTKTYGGTETETGRSVQQTDGGYIITGWTDSFGAGSSDVYLVKTDVIGDTLWTKTFGGANDDWSNSVQQTDDGGYIIGGGTGSFGAGERDVYLIKIDTNGDTLWTKTFGGTSSERGHSVQQTDDGGYIITGYTHSFGAGGSDVYLVKTDTNGDTLWTKTFGGTSLDEGHSVQQTDDGGYIITGSTSSFGAGNSDVYLVKTDTNGDTLWTKTYGGTSADVGNSVKQTDDGGYIIAGLSGSFGAGDADVYLVKTDTNGDTLWTKTFGGSGGWDEGNSVQQTEDGGYIITGRISSFGAGNADVYLIKTDSLGNAGEVGIEEEHTSHYPIRFWIAQNYPNPFNPTTTIEFSLPTSGLVTLTVYDVMARNVETILNQHMDAGIHSVQWNANKVPSGIYFVKMVSENFSQTRKMVLLK
ncbi:MAG: T9SS type A sorting domain-containing protein [Candidatus Marinimicrobia bacterium]|nr:T9SS type A sorting domain-containing protein [Candidatus Neomarinimicrobiota bacterium]